MRSVLNPERGLSRAKIGMAWFLFGAYSLFMIYLLFFGFNRSSRPEQRMYNVIPFKTISSYIVNYSHYNFGTWFINLFGNVGAFVPFGFLIPFLFRKVNKWAQITLLFLGLLLTVETLQFIFRVGSFDVDDILLNVLGGWIGFAIFKIYRGLRR